MKILKVLSSFLKSSLIKSSGAYTFSTIFEKAIPFLLLPVLTRFLSAEDYGIVSMFTVLVGLATPFTGLGIKAAILRNYYKKGIDFPAYVSTALSILIVSTSIVFGLFLLFSDIISLYAGFPANWLVAVVVVAAGQFIINIVLVIWQAEVKPLPYGVFKVSATALNMGLSILLIVGLGYNWEGRVIGQSVAVILFCLGALIILFQKKLIRFQIVNEYVKHALRYGVPLIPHIVSGILITYIDRIFITNMIGVAATGIYTVGYQIGMIIGVLASSFNTAWTPWLYDKLNEGEEIIKRKIVKFTYSYFVVIILMALTLSFIAPWFMSFFVGDEFQGSVPFIFWIALGYSFNGMYFMVTNYIFYVEKTYILSILTLISAIVNIIFNYVFINRYGSIGAAMATSLSYFCLFILAWIWANKYYKMPWLLWK